MWLKLVLITIYLSILFIFSRLFDIAIRTYENNTFSLLPSRLVLNPVILSVKHLKHVLDYRGVSYAGFAEKKELRALVEASGEVTKEELELDSEWYETDQKENNEHDKNEDLRENETGSTTYFTCGTHFYELVEDTKDSAWLILVKPHSYRNKLVNDKIWNQIVRKASKFGILTGVFDCSLDPLLCQNKKWSTPRLLLALPRDGLISKQDIIFTTFLIGTNPNPLFILNWIHKQLGARIKQISSLADLKNNWLTQETPFRIKLVFISTLTTPPLILSALAIKYSGRVSFGVMKPDEKTKRHLISKLDKKLPLYIIVANNQYYLYGQRPGETFTYKSMNLILKSFTPEMNDIFLLSLFLMNMSIALHFFWMKCSRLWKHLIYWFIQLIKCNCLLFMVWLLILTLQHVPLMQKVTLWGFYFCQLIASSEFESLLRYDAQYYFKIPSISSSLLAFGMLLAFSRRKLLSSENEDYDDEILNQDWTPFESTLISYLLFRPMGMSSLRPVSSSIDANLEEGMELLIERLAVPNLWLQPNLIANEYIKDLPVWSHIGESDEDLDNMVYQQHSSSEHSDSEIRTQETLKFSLKENEYFHSPSNSSQIQDEDVNCGCAAISSINRRPSTSGHMKCNSENLNLICEERELKKSEKVQKLSQEMNEQNFIPDGILPCKECAICLELYKNGQLICGLPCGHNYHENCIMLWLYRDNHCCPKCRFPTYKQKAKIS